MSQVITNNNILVIGIGNPMRGDDAIGIDVVRRLKQGSDLQCEILGGQSTELLNAWRDYSHVLVVDAIQAKDHEVGTVKVFNFTRDDVPAEFFTGSTHGLGLYEAYKLGEVINQSPENLVVVGVVGKNFEMGGSLSPEVAAALGPALSQLETIVNCWKR